MAIQSGTHLGPYEILSAIGAGGMGEVYRAHDPKLGRDVAIKVLPEAFARDAERMARFQREAKVLASLDHPNIASIYGLEDSGGTRALVMQLVEGPTLADRIKAGPIPVDEAVRIARQIADALEYAHERGIIHRDLKPANVKVTNDDAVKVLDFGLAKALEGDPSSIDISTSPTISRMATQAGMLLGTAAYMSPEQAKAKSVDRRADIWAFGCVLYEMLMGKTAFKGETVTDTLASVIKEEPDWKLLPAATPMRVRVLLQRCLQKDPKERLQAIGDARIALNEVLSGAPEPVGSAGASPAKSAFGPRMLLLFSLATLIIAALASVATWNLKPSPSPSAKPVTRFTITLPPGQRLAGLNGPALALSPDGSELAYIATNQVGGPQQIYVRAMDSTETRAIPGTEGAVGPFFSPDAQWLGFFADGKLKKISVHGGVAQSLADVAGPLGGCWADSGTIIFAIAAGPLQQVPDAGGSPQPVTRLDKGEYNHAAPEFLPISKAVLFLHTPSGAIAVEAIGTGEGRNLIRGQPAATPRYAPSGHLIYGQAGSLMAAPFNPERLELKGAAVPVVQGVLETGAYQYSVSAMGSLVYVSGGVLAAQSRLVWVNRNGAEQPLAAPARDYDMPRLSPDGRRIAVDIGNQVWLYDLARDTLSRFTFEGSINGYPVWSPDGNRIAFTSDIQGPLGIFWQLADGGGGLERLVTTTYSRVSFSWSPDGQVLTFVEVTPTTGADIWVLRMGDRKAQPFLQTPAFEDAPQFSPDGHWITYASDESGRREIYVQPYPGPGGKWLISTEGGNEPTWNRNGRELFYRNGNKMMAVDISTQPGFVAGKPRQLFERHYMMNPLARPDYDVSPDGQRFLMLEPVEQEQMGPTQINVVLNWTEELKRLVPTGTK
jgi:eukaryotic-like serine/threonine-protein kinase